MKMYNKNMYFFYYSLFMILLEKNKINNITHAMWHNPPRLFIGRLELSTFGS